jgi:hypothetical protein
MNKHEIVKRLEYCAENKCELCQQENGSGFPWMDVATDLRKDCMTQLHC